VAVSPLRPWLLLLACLPCCCGPSLAPALEEFEAGRLPQALGELRRLEPGLAAAGEADRARYGLYRGLTELALGDARAAERWLTSVKRSLDQDPGLLNATERGQLFAAWRSMGRMPGE
jgi:hypothetical protein